MGAIGKVASAAVLLLSFPSLTLAQTPPQIGAAASIFGGSPDATFYAGARIDQGPYLDTVERTADFQLEIQLDPVAEAVGSPGAVFVLVLTSGGAYALLESGEWAVFDGTIAGLRQAKAIVSYPESFAFTVNNVADLFLQDGMPIVDGEVNLSIYVAYNAGTLGDDLHFSSVPLQLTLVDSGLKRDAVLPELPNPSTLTSSATSARFFGGAALAGSNDFSNPVYESTEQVAVTLEFMPEIAQFDQPGKAFVLGFAGGVPHTLNEARQWNAWDGSVDGLLNNPTASYPELLSYHQIDASSIIELITREGVQIVDNAVAFQIFTAFQSDAVPGQLYYSGVPAQFTITLPVYIDPALAYYQDNGIEEGIIQARCVVCHVENGVASNTGLVFERNGPGALEHNFEVFSTFVSSTPDAVNYVLNKASGAEPHTGGVQLAQGSDDYDTLGAFLQLLPPLNEQAFALYEDTIEAPIVQGRCVVCHVDNNVASNTDLVFQRTGPTSLQHNYGQFNGLVNSIPDGVGYVLSKVSGELSHTGGIQLSQGSAGYNELEAFLTALANTNTKPSGEVTVSGTASQGETLTAANNLADPDVIGFLSFQWNADDVPIAGANGVTLELSQNEVGKAITVTASYTDGGGTLESVTSAATAQVTNSNDSPVGTVSVTGTPTQGQTLTASDDLQDTDGLGPLTYQWQAGGTPIDGATDNTFVLTQNEVGKVVSVTVSYTDGGGTAESVNSTATTAVANINDAPSGGVAVVGLPAVGQILAVSNDLTDPDGLGPIAYQWFADGIPIIGATAHTLSLTEDEGNMTITVTASYTDEGGAFESVTSGPSDIVALLPDYRGDALAFYEDNISGQVVQTLCIACHVEGGDARAANLIFQRPGPASALNNFATFDTFLNSREDGVDWILTKASGGEDHTGGIQIASGGTDYNNMATFLELLSPQNEQAEQLHEDSVEPTIVQAKCIECHVQEGDATETGLVFERTGVDSTPFNYMVFEDFVSTTPNARDYILSKASGGDDHTGGIQLASGGTDYNNLAAFLDSLIYNKTSIPIALSQQFFEGVSYQSTVETLRRAAIIFAGRAPYQDEIDAVADGDDNTLRFTIRNLMDGDGFHEFLVTGANDRLLVRGTPDGTFLDGDGVHPEFQNRLIDILLADFNAGRDWSFDLDRFYSGIDRGLRDSPLELIAYVVENDLPYSEILTADYMMLNPLANFAVDGTAVFNNSDDMSEFQPGREENYVLNDGSVEFEFVEPIQNYRFVGGGFTIDYPHAGILNTQSFLFRYPTTPTNRNRARARWTFLHFLDIDIEKSAQRTTDPAALADTNNPTLNNPACTVCHVTMDPVAGAFQNYADQFAYRSQIPGTDSLDQMYKYEQEGSPYQEGDTWYRDMRIPGIFGEEAPDSDNSLQWLSQQIVQEPGFARAAVKFWWPSVIGQKPLRLPEVEEDATYDAQLMAFDAQNATIQELSDEFLASGMNLKDLLVELVMSPWFRADSIDSAELSTTQLSAHNSAALGDETLLTPERLARKTRTLTGYGWNTFYKFNDDRVYQGLTDGYGQYYGGIDSLAITQRATEMTPLMSTVAMTHALQASCPIVLKDFIFADGQRRLFNNISELITPLTESGERFNLETEPADSPVFTVQDLIVDLNPGQKIAEVTLENGDCVWDEPTQSCLASSSLILDSIEIRPPGAGTGTVYQADQLELDESCSYEKGDGDVVMDGLCTIGVPFTSALSGQHTVLATLAAVKYGQENPRTQSLDVSLTVNTAENPLESTAAGAELIKQKLVDLHFILLGKTFEIDSPEIETAYQLLVESWQDRLNNDASGNLIWSNLESCQWQSDAFFFDDLPVEGDFTSIEYDDRGYPGQAFDESTWEIVTQAGSDPTLIKGVWVTVITYLLTHYHYLYE